MSNAKTAAFPPSRCLGDLPEPTYDRGGGRAGKEGRGWGREDSLRLGLVILLTLCMYRSYRRW